MSVNSRIFLSSDVRSLDVAKAVAVLAGLPPSSTEHGLTVRGLEPEPLAPGAAVAFRLKGAMVDGSTEHRFCVYYESSDVPGHDREISVVSTPFWLAVGKRLIRFFGGALLYADCGNLEPDERMVRLWPYPQQADDAGSLALASRIFKLEPLTMEEINSAANFSYYDGLEE